MKFPSPEFDDAVAAVCHGSADDARAEGLAALLATSDAALDAYLMHAEVHAALSTSPDFLVPVDLSSLGDGHGLCDPLPLTVATGDLGPDCAAAAGPHSGRGWLIASTVASLVLLAAFAVALVVAPSFRPGFGGGRPGETARASMADAPRSKVGVFAELNSIVWVAADKAVEAGDPVREGDRLELAGGSLRISLDNGASVQLTGPAIFEIESALSAVLTMGRVQVTADTPGSKGFTIRTRTGRIVDLGTEFVAEALPDGRCRVGVTSGEVRFHLANAVDGQLLRAGELMEVEPGSRQVVTRIEPGDETPDFRFPTIERPSATDFADQALGRVTIQRIKGRLYENPRKQIFSASPDVLLDGKGQSNADAPAESLYFSDYDEGQLVVDLGAEVGVTKVNVYSWHLCRNPGFPSDLREAHRERAAQNYVLYGHAAADAPEAGEDPAAAGWTLIARVNSDEYFGLTGIKRPAQQASSVTSARGSLGRFRHLLFVVQPTKGVNHDGGKTDFSTFFGEIDVYAE